jgi:hypothetical protein
MLWKFCSIFPPVWGRIWCIHAVLWSLSFSSTWKSQI